VKFDIQTNSKAIKTHVICMPLPVTRFNTLLGKSSFGFWNVWATTVV